MRRPSELSKDLECGGTNVGVGAVRREYDKSERVIQIQLGSGTSVTSALL
jgi:hypothetical protein